MLDIHTHILPKADNGSESIKESLALLRKEAKQGIDAVVLTPHYFAQQESIDRFLDRCDAIYEDLEYAAAGRKGMPRMILGAEVAYFGGMSRVEGIENLCIAGTQAMLIEMPLGKWNRAMIDELIFLKQSMGVRPILAHVERYLKYQPPGTIRKLCEAGIWLQANASFFLKWKTSWLAMRMLKRRAIQFVASNCHDAKNRVPNLDKAIARIDEKLGERTLNYLKRMEQRLLEGK